ncbi:YIP1 family protein [Desulfolutivibrio sp.]|uniref:YIP1 family protein n=1 Tax=Desulfolutivibrio sp. TaxID=2773296 RepID=UPI002F96B0FD
MAPEESAPLRMTPHPAAMDQPPRPEHAEERLRACEPAAREPRSEARQEQNGVRDIWARLQAMDDEDTARLTPPRPAAPVPDGPARGAPIPAGEPPAGRIAGESEPDPTSGVRPQAVPPQAAMAPEETSGHRQAAAPGGDGPAPGNTGDAPGADTRGGDGPGARDSSSSPDSPDSRESSGSSSSSGSSDSSGPFQEGRPGEAAKGEVPWERPDVYGFFPGLVLTLKSILFQPVEFFESMPPGRGKGKAMVFNLLLSEFLLLVDFLWALLGVRAKLADTGQTDALAAMAGVPGIGFLILLIMVPVFMAAGIYLDAGLTHLLLMLLRGNSKKFDETFRVMCYSAAPTVLSAVPVAGQLLSPVILIWYMTLQAIGLKKVHGAAYSQALAVVLIKWSLYLFLLLGMLHGLSSGG